MSLTNLLPLAPLLVLPLLPSLGGPTWSTDLAAALRSAGDPQRPVLVAVGMRDEGRCERLRKEVYDERAFTTQLADSPLLIGCADVHREDKECPLYDGVRCREHMRFEAELREELLAAGAGGVVAVPQHVWLGPDGAVLLSVPYELDIDELRWCQWQARARLDAGAAGAPPADARPPRRLLIGELYRPGGADPLGRGLSETEVEENIKALKGSMFGGGRIGRMQRLLFTDDEEAVHYAGLELGSALLSWGGTEMLERAIHAMGVLSPESYWEVITDFARDAKPSVRKEAAVALEQLGSPRALKVIKSSLSREKDPAVKQSWLRALGACGWKDKSARKSLLKAVEKEKKPLLRRSALFALGYLSAHEDVDARLRLELRDAVIFEDRLAAACAMALTRRPAFRTDLAVVIEACADEAQRGDYELAAGVLDGENLRVIEELVSRILADELKRERVFFHASGGPAATGR